MRTIAEIFQSHEILDDDGRHINGTDKEGPNHRYGNAYESLFPDRESIKLMMEVGVADGSSLLAWRDIFPNALCIGMDIHPASRLMSRAIERIEFHLGDQRSQQDCQRVCNERQFNFICEDATHQLADSLCTLLYLWPFIKPGGIYVIEEFANVLSLRRNITDLWPNAEVIETVGPFGGIEPLVVIRKPS